MDSTSPVDNVMRDRADAVHSVAVAAYAHRDDDHPFYFDADAAVHAYAEPLIHTYAHRDDGRIDLHVYADGNYYGYFIADRIAYAFRGSVHGVSAYADTGNGDG